MEIGSCKARKRLYNLNLRTTLCCGHKTTIHNVKWSSSTLRIWQVYHINIVLTIESVTTVLLWIIMKTLVVIEDAADRINMSFKTKTSNSSGDDIAKRDFSVYLFIPQLYISSMPDSPVDHPFLFNPLGGDPLGRSSWFSVGELPDGQATIWCKNIPEKLPLEYGARTSQTTDRQTNRRICVATIGRRPRLIEFG